MSEPKHRHPASMKGAPDGSQQVAINQLRDELAGSEAQRKALVAKVAEMLDAKDATIRALRGALRDFQAPGVQAARLLGEDET